MQKEFIVRDLFCFYQAADHVPSPILAKLRVWLSQNDYPAIHEEFWFPKLMDLLHSGLQRNRPIQVRSEVLITVYALSINVEMQRVLVECTGFLDAILDNCVAHDFILKMTLTIIGAWARAECNRQVFLQHEGVMDILKYFARQHGIEGKETQRIALLALCLLEFENAYPFACVADEEDLMRIWSNARVMLVLQSVSRVKRIGKAAPVRKLPVELLRMALNML